MNNYYFTFGSNHTDIMGRSLGRNFVKVRAKTEHAARNIMHRARGSVWAFVYTEEQFAGQAEQFYLTEKTLNEVHLPHEPN